MRALLSILVLVTVALAYNPPSGTAGPLTVRMQAPATGSYSAIGFVELSRPGVPMSLPVSLQTPHDNYIDFSPISTASATRASSSAKTVRPIVPGSTTAAKPSPTAPALTG